METLNFLKNKYNLEINKKTTPFEIPNVGRSTLVEWLSELGFTKGVEVGVANGDYSEEIVLKNPQMTLYGVDPWLPYVDYKDYMKQSTFDKMYSNTVDRMSNYDNYHIIRATSMEAIKQFEDESLDFVYIDGNHQDPFVSEDIREWYKKVKKGGILAGHDYIRQEGLRCDVIPAIHKFTEDNKIDPWFVLGRMAKREGLVRDTTRSWMIIK